MDMGNILLGELDSSENYRFPNIKLTGLNRVNVHPNSNYNNAGPRQNVYKIGSVVPPGGLFSRLRPDSAGHARPLHQPADHVATARPLQGDRHGRRTARHRDPRRRLDAGDFLNPDAELGHLAMECMALNNYQRPSVEWVYSYGWCMVATRTSEIFYSGYTRAFHETRDAMRVLV
ncbi:Uu.00g029970.m01.CDS01 [Anthostomella pinea]|uniref:Uu.00g029970.m01.CDS01 n=1 Tax=Anthostomella pinea TaxID=933095 RepID=A0AAI8YAJ0_9PEZI|nr:Uu.00g029970.m01.CDS01 [Anthostomella pinea]